MTRAGYRNRVVDNSGNPVDDASINIFDLGTTDEISETIFADRTGGTTRLNPFTVDAGGYLEFWLDVPKRVDLRITGTGLTPDTFSVDLQPSADETTHLFVIANVKNYGAVGDGVTNDTAAIQAAIDAVEDAGGGIVFLPEGTYLISATLTISADFVTFMGASASATVINYSGSGIAIAIEQLGDSDGDPAGGWQCVGLEHFRLSDTGTGTIGVRWNGGGTHTRFRNRMQSVQVTGFSTAGIQWTGRLSEMSEHRDIYCYGNGIGFQVSSPTGDCPNMTFINCRSHENTGRGWDMDNLLSATFINCQGLRNGNGTVGPNGEGDVQFNLGGACRSCTIIGFDAENFGDHSSAGVGVQVSGSQHIIQGCILQSVEVGWRLSNADRCTVFQNDYGTGLTDNGRIATGSSDNVIFDLGEDDIADSGTNTWRFGVGRLIIPGELQLVGDLNHDGSNVGFYGTTPTAKPSSTTDLRAALVNLGLYTGGGATPLNLNGGKLTCDEAEIDGVLNHDGSTVGFFGVTPVIRPTSTTDLRAALVNLGLYTGGGATPLNLNGGKLQCDEAEIDGILNHDGTTLGFYGVSPVPRPAAYTQTYATATRTHANPTADAVVETAATQSSPWGYSSQAQADSIPVEINDLRDDLLNVKQLLNQVIDDLQIEGLLQ